MGLLQIDGVQGKCKTKIRSVYRIHENLSEHLTPQSAICNSPIMLKIGNKIGGRLIAYFLLSLFIIYPISGCSTNSSTTTALAQNNPLGTSNIIKQSRHNKSIYLTQLTAHDKKILRQHASRALAAYDIYYREKNNLSHIVGTSWYNIKFYNDKISGFTAGIYKNQKTGATIIALGGTGAGSNLIQDITSDILLPAQKIINLQLIRLRFFLDNLPQEIKNSSYHISGHSLGGSLAKYASLYTGHKATTFNSATFTRNQRATTHLKPYTKTTAAKLITDIRMSNDPLNLAIKLAQKIDAKQDYTSEEDMLYKLLHQSGSKLLTKLINLTNQQDTINKDITNKDTINKNTTNTSNNQLTHIITQNLPQITGSLITFYRKKNKNSAKNMLLHVKKIYGLEDENLSKQIVTGEVVDLNMAGKNFLDAHSMLSIFKYAAIFIP